MDYYIKIILNYYFLLLLCVGWVPSESLDLFLEPGGRPRLDGCCGNVDVLGVEEIVWLVCTGFKGIGDCTGRVEATG